MQNKDQNSNRTLTPNQVVEKYIIEKYLPHLVQSNLSKQKIMEILQAIDSSDVGIDLGDINKSRVSLPDDANEELDGILKEPINDPYLENSFDKDARKYFENETIEETGEFDRVFEDNDFEKMKKVIEKHISNVQRKRKRKKNQSPDASSAKKRKKGKRGKQGL